MWIRALSAAVPLVLNAAQAAEPQLSPGPTLDYIAKQYAAGALLPQLTIHVEYRPPFLDVKWQKQGAAPSESAASTAALVEEEAEIDLRYARFDSWNDGRRDRNIMLIECRHYFPCYSNPLQHVSIGHGEIGYPVRAFAREALANALNHLASFHEKERPKGPFD